MEHRFGAPARTIAILLAAVWALFAAASSASNIVFTNARVLTMADGPRYRPMDLLVAGDRFAEGAPSADAERIDLGGRYVIPGLVEMHAHVPVGLDSTYRDDVLFLWVANGVTRARGMLGHPSHLPLRDALARHEVLGPALFTSGPSFGGRDTDPAEAAARVRRQKAAGYDFLKIHPGLSAEVFEAVARTARTEDIAFAGHITGAVGLFASLAAGQETVDHLDGLVETLVDPARLEDRSPAWFGADLTDDASVHRIDAAIAALKASGAALVPTETLLENIAGDVAELTARPQYRYLPARLRDSYERAVRGSAGAFPGDRAARFLALRKRIIGTAFEAGVPVLLGADSPQIFNVPGFSLHRELEAMVAAGLSAYDAIASGSARPAEFFGQSGQWGSIVAGASADFIVLDEDPLEDIANSRSIHAVLVRGRYLPRAELDQGLADIRERYR